MSESYVEIMLQSLEKKELVLEGIIELNQSQRTGLESPNFTPEEFDDIVESKSRLIEQLEQLDSGFEKLFEQMKDELESNKEFYKEQILAMQEHIKAITDKSVQIQAQESRNKDLMTQKFAQIKSQAKSVRSGGKVADQYRKNMAKLNYIEPQFMDNKN